MQETPVSAILAALLLLGAAIWGGAFLVKEARAMQESRERAVADLLVENTPPGPAGSPAGRVAGR